MTTRDDMPMTAKNRGQLIAELTAANAELARLRLLQKAASDSSTWRPEVIWFATAMETTLRKNDAAKGERGWQNESAEWLVKKLDEEVGELKAFGGLLDGAQHRQMERPEDPGHRATVAREILSECTDVAAIVMMIADLCARGVKL